MHALHQVRPRREGRLTAPSAGPPGPRSGAAEEIPPVRRAGLRQIALGLLVVGIVVPFGRRDGIGAQLLLLGGLLLVIAAVLVAWWGAYRQIAIDEPPRTRDAWRARGRQAARKLAIGGIAVAAIGTVLLAVA